MAPRLRQLRLIAALAALLLAPLGTARAADAVHYFNVSTFDIPVEWGRGGQHKQATLYVSTDGKLFQVAGTVAAGKDSFSYTAPADGWYFFVLQLEDQDGKKWPDPITPEDVSLKVCVDRKKPEITLRPTLPQEGSVAVVWKIEERAIDTIVLEYSPKGRQEWQNVPIKPLPHAQRSWAPAGAGPFDVRLTVKDRAGNVATATTQVSAKSGGGAGGSVTGARSERHVPSKTFKLNYKVAKVGPSRIKNVEIWWTEDTRTWQVLKSDAPSEGPVSITVPAERAYGFTIRPVNGVGRGPEAPRPFQEPQIWIRVDETKPRVTLRNYVVGDGADATLTINWQAVDDHFGDRPITLSYSPDGREWKELKANLENTGTYTCSTKDLPFEFHLRVEATDKAGNKATAETRDPVKVDNSVPEVKDIGVSVDVKGEGGGAPAAPTSTGGGPPGVPPPLPGG